MDSFAPRRPVIVLDSSKMDFFARAAMVRAGVMGTYGALSGAPTGTFGASLLDDADRFNPNLSTDLGSGASLSTGRWSASLLDPSMDANRTGVATESNTPAPSGGSSVADYLARLFQPSAPLTPPPLARAPASFLGIPVTALLIGGAVLVGGLFVVKMKKK